MKKNKLRAALIRAIVAAVLALALLAFTGFAFIDMLKGAAIQSDLSRLSPGDYVTVNIDMILGYYAEEYRGGKVTTHYAIVPQNGVLYTVILPERYFESADTIFDSSYDFINGETDRITQYILVTGTAGELGEEAAGLFYDWFGLNKDWLGEAGLTSAEVTDYSAHLSTTALRADSTGRLPSVWAWILTGLAWLLLFYAVTVLLRMTLGKYGPKSGAAGTAKAAATAHKSEAESSEKAAQPPRAGPAGAEPDEDKEEKFEA